MDQDVKYSTKEAAKYLACSPHTLDKWRKKGIGPTYTLYNGNSRVRYLKRDLDAFIEKSKVICT